MSEMLGDLDGESLGEAVGDLDGTPRRVESPGGTLEGDSVGDDGRLGWRISWRGSGRHGRDPKES
jgi:hypothetical protein